MRCFFQFIHKFCGKYVRLFYINNLMKKTVQKNYNHVYMLNLINAINSYCKKAFVTYRFDNYCKRFIVKFFFLFISISYQLCFLLQDMLKLIFLQFEVPFFYNDISFIQGAYQFTNTVFHQQVICFFYSYLPFRLIMLCHSFFKRCQLIYCIIIYVQAKYMEYSYHKLMRFGHI